LDSDNHSYEKKFPDYTGDDKKHYRNSSINGCFGWVRRWICEKNDFESDNDSYGKENPDDAGEGTKHSRDSSTSGCFGWIQRWIYEQHIRKSDRQRPATATAQRPERATAQRSATATAQRPARGAASVTGMKTDTATCSRGDQRVFFTDADCTLHEREAQWSMLNNEDAVELVLKDIVQKQDVWHILKENIHCILQRGK
jgi:hypothetical protein